MKTYLVDSDILIDFFKKIPEATKLIEELGDLGNIVISVISVSELRSGWTEKEAAIYIRHLYNIFEVIPLTKDIAEVAAKYRQRYGEKGITLPTIDALIAATAKAYGYRLVTRNIKHYPMPEIDLYKDIY